MTPETLRHIGAALYGPSWQAELAKALGVNDRTMRRWLTGETPIPKGIGADLLPICGQRLDELEAVFDQLEQETSQ